jgi:hypothetical protein
VLWYPTQAKTGLEWGTQLSLPVKQADHHPFLNLPLAVVILGTTREGSAYLSAGELGEG